MKSALKIVLIYILFASLWILVSDTAIHLFSEGLEDMSRYSTIKGLFFVLVTGLLLFFLVRREVNAKNVLIESLNRALAVKRQLIRELHHRIKNNLQVVISLLNLESRGKGLSAEAMGGFVGKLLSMKAVFNIVYNVEDMNTVVFRDVLEEYARLKRIPLTVVEAGPGKSESIETMVSLLLVVDMLVQGAGNIRDLVIELMDDGTIEISSGETLLTGKPSREKDIELMNVLLESVHGCVDPPSAPSGCIRIRYSDAAV